MSGFGRALDEILLYIHRIFVQIVGSKIRLVTLDASIDLLKGMVLSGEGKSFLADTHFAQLEGIKEESTLLLRNFYKVIFPEVFFFEFFYNPYLTIRAKYLIHCGKT